MISVNYTIRNGQYLPRLDNPDNCIPKLRLRALVCLAPYLTDRLTETHRRARLLRACGAGNILRSYFSHDQVRYILAAVRAFNASYLINALTQHDNSPLKGQILSDSASEAQQ